MERNNGKKRKAKKKLSEKMSSEITQDEIMLGEITKTRKVKHVMKIKQNKMTKTCQAT